MAKKNKNNKKSKTDTPVFDNRRARYDYFIEDTIEVGIVLEGSEVKSIREGHCSLKEGFVTVDLEPHRLTLHQVDIPPYQPAGALNHRPKRDRMLLAKKREIEKLARAVDVKGVTLVPLKLYFSGAHAKISLAIAKGKAQHDKRNAIADRENQRDMQRAMSQRMKF
ncbi:MAG: SsrA-binding protein SmpB [Phycisphaerales bacterium]|nr:SsrA-binding protein SmpB [Phycisphaerales bacterium]